MSDRYTSQADPVTLDDRGIDYSREAQTDGSAHEMLWIPLLNRDGTPPQFVMYHRIINCSTPELAALFCDAFNAKVGGHEQK